MLDEKKTLHGDRGGFFENNFPAEANFCHALGEARIKISEYRKAGRPRLLIKAITWLYLVYEAQHVWED